MYVTYKCKTRIVNDTHLLLSELSISNNIVRNYVEIDSQHVSINPFVMFSGDKVNERPGFASFATRDFVCKLILLPIIL